MKLSKYQRAPVEEVPRMDINGVPYNPRHITPAERKKLQASIKKRGLIGDPVVNRRTEKKGWEQAERGLYLVGGHQRIAALDALEGNQDYLVRVIVVELDEHKEREANIALNNPSIGGSYDLAKLEEVLQTPGLDVLATGFERLDLEINFGDTFGHLFSEEAAPARAKKAAKDVAEIANAAKKRRKEYKEQDGARTNDVEYVAVVVFDNSEQRERFMEHVGADPGMRMVPGRVVAASMPGLELP